MAAPGENERAALVQAAGETERIVAWLRLPAIALLAAGQGIQHPEPHGRAFAVTIVVFSAWSAALLAWVYLRPVTTRFALTATGADVVAITVLAILSGGAFSQARLAYFVIPIAVAFRFRPSATAVASASTVAAYLAQALAHPAASRPEAARFIAIHAGYLLWVGGASVLLSFVLARRTGRVLELAAAREQLLADALSAEERERQFLAEALHDQAIQNLLSARHELEEVGEDVEHPSLRRAEQALADTVDRLRRTIVQLHPHVLEQAGIEVALPAVGQQLARQGGFRLAFDLRYRRRHSEERLLLAVARELLANVAAHAQATEVVIGLHEDGGELVLTVSDNGRGFDPDAAARRVAEGHIGLASQRVRVESVGGRLEIQSAPGAGTTAEVRLPLDGRPRD